MEKPRWVVVFNNSLYMAGIAASLKADPTLEVHSIDLDHPCPRQILDEIDIAAIVFDLCNPPACLDIALLSKRPGLVLIGVDLTKDEMLVLSSHPSQALRIADLVNVIHQNETSPSVLSDAEDEKSY
jgi:hypothetical protein